MVTGGSLLSDSRTAESASARFYNRLFQKNIPGLDGLRGLAALAVVGMHQISAWFPGALAVTVFFVLSGFLITWLLLKEQAAAATISLRRFYIARTMRIFPAFYVYSAVQLLTVSPHIPWIPVLASSLYVSSYASYLHNFEIMRHTWSLSIEEHFYLLWPLTFLLTGANRTRLLWSVVTAIVAGIVWKSVVVQATGVKPDYLYYASEMRFPELLTGCLLALVLHRRPRIPAALLHPFALVVPVGVLAFSGALDALYVPGFYHNVVSKNVAAFATTLLIMHAIAFSASGQILSFLETGVMKYLGRISYAVYLYHVIPVEIAPKLPIKWRYQILFTFAVTIAAATLSLYLVEAPALRLKERLIRRYADRPRTARAAA